MKRLGSGLSIRHILVGVISAMALLASGLTLQAIWTAYARRDVSQQVVSLAELNKNLFEALGSFRLERAAMQSAVILPADRAQESVKTYEMRRRLVEDALARANAVLGPSQRPALVAARTNLAAAHDENRKIREAVEAALKQPVEARDKQLAGQVLAVGEKLLVSLDRASLAVDGEIRTLNPALTELVAARALAWSTRTHAGVAGIMISTIAAQARPLDAKESAALLGANSSALAIWNSLRDIADTAQAEPAIKAAIAKAQTTYFSGPTHEMREALSQRVTSGGKPDVSVDQWRNQIVPALETIANVAAVAIDQAIAVAAAADRAAFVNLIGYAALLGLGLLLAVIGFVVVRSRVTAPLGAMTAAMTQLAGGDLAASLPSVRHRDEMGAMASALSVFRDNLIKMRELEQQEQAQASERLARAESMASVVSDVGAVVEAAAVGDFSARLALDHADAEMGKLVSGINEINRVVDAATTEFAEALQAIAAGDLTYRIDSAYRGRFAELKQAINDTADKLSATLRTIQTTASDVGLSAREISTGADDLSKRTEEQASSLEESAATTEELAASVKAAAQASQQGVVLSGEAMQVAQDGGSIVTNAVSAMARIEEASKKISDIIRVIDDIAFQTNLLALNAAVEAARAGDAGKGFAVVASEVRTLAQRSSEAAKDISGLISSSNAEVEQGVKLVRQAGDALTRIVEASHKVQATVSEVAAAASEQANGIEEMSQTVAHMDEMTQANAALAEQSAASANALAAKIGELNALVATFQTGESGPASAAAAPYAPPRLRAAGQGSEPQRLRQLAEAAFAQQHKATPRQEARVSAPARKVANARAGDAGWEEF